MNPAKRKLFSALAVVAGVMLIFFELRHDHGVTGDNVFWLFVGGFIIVLGVIDLVQKRPAEDGKGGSRND